MVSGRTLNGRYNLIRQLGEGGMGTVYEARHTGTGRRVAVKQMTREVVKNKTFRARFEMEARAAGQLETQHVAQVLDLGEDEAGAPYIVMEYLDGEDLSHLIKRVGPLPSEVALRLMVQACLGLEKAHAAGIIHRDIKPANMYLAERDSGEVVLKLLDFGIAKVVAPDSPAGSTLTRSGSLLGSPQYMSPEQARGTKALDHCTDIWSLGVVLYQMLAGRTPYHRIDAMGELIITLCSGPPPPVQIEAPWVRPEVAAVVERALAFEPAARFQTAAEMASAMKALLPGGWSVDRSMLAPLPEEARALVAPKTALAAKYEASGGEGSRSADALELASAATVAATPSSRRAAEADSSAGATTGGTSLSRTGARERRRSMLPWMIACGALGAAVAIVVLGRGSGPSTEPPAGGAAATTAATVTATAAETTAAPTIAPATVQPTIAPATAQPTGAPSADVSAAPARGPRTNVVTPHPTQAPAAPTATAKATASGPAKGVDVWGRE